MLNTVLERPVGKKQRDTRSVSTRIKFKDLEAIQPLVDKHFQGNYSLMLRKALDKYLTEIQMTGEIPL